MRFQAPRGTEDVLPTEAATWRRLEAIWSEVTARYGYGEIRTPTFEDTALFTRTSGETSDIVSKEMYTFEDKGGRSVTLRPEGTAPAMRAVIEHSLCPPGTVLRLQYTICCFRYGRPQKGRLRELHQFGLELVGSSAAEADAEVIELTVRFFQAIGLKNVSVLLNSIGRDECRSRYREAILQHLAAYLQDQDDSFRAQAEKNPLRLLDTKDAALRTALEGLAPITDYLEDPSRARLDRIQQRLTEANVPFQLRPDVVRGLDYYTETVFEVEHEGLGAQSSVCGGGRYDDLVAQLGGSSTPSVGVGIGIERTLLALAGEGVTFPAEPLTAFIVGATDSALDATVGLARELRDAGYRVLTDLDARSLKSQLRQADKSGATWALVIGDDELARNTVQVKDLREGAQRDVPREEIVAWLQGAS